MSPSSLRSFVLFTFAAALAGCSYYPSETSNGTGGTTATGGSAGQHQGGSAQGGGGASQGGQAQGGNGNGTGGTVVTGGSGGSPPVEFFSCADIAAYHAVMKVQVTGPIPGGFSRIAADGYNTKQNPGWKVQHVGALGATETVLDYGVSLPGFKAELNWGFASDDATKVVGDPAPIVESGTWFCRWSVCEDANIIGIEASFLGCFGTEEIGRITSIGTVTGSGMGFAQTGDEANVTMTVP